MSARYVMPERLPGDGPIAVERSERGIRIRVTNGDATTLVEMSEHNAWRVFGSLALVLGLPLPASVGKAITF
jgi:hypothetical protein